MLINDLEVLKYALKNDMIDMSSIQSDIKMKKEKEYLDMHNYEIWQGKNGKWYTYIPDVNKGRRLIKRTKEEDIKKTIINFYQSIDTNRDQEESKQNLTLRKLYYEWIKFKTLKTNSSSYIKRINADWKTFYENDKISNMPIKSLTKITLDSWAHGMIKTHDMTKTQYYNMSIIIRQGLDYAKECGYIDHNYFNDFSIDSKMFRGKGKVNNKKEVFLTSEEPTLKLYCQEMNEKHPHNTTPLAILLMFELGCRVGELVALSKSDICGNYVDISHQEVSVFDSNNSCKYIGTKVVSYTKTDAGNRKQYLSKEARTLIDKILATNEKYGYMDGDFIILNHNGRTHGMSVNRRLGEYCRFININHKTTHKIRKTYISKMIDGNMNIKSIMQQVGHSSAKTTYSNYCFDRSTEIEYENKMEQILCSNQ